MDLARRCLPFVESWSRQDGEMPGERRCNSMRRAGATVAGDWERCTVTNLRGAGGHGPRPDEAVPDTFVNPGPNPPGQGRYFADSGSGESAAAPGGTRVEPGEPAPREPVLEPREQALEPGEPTTAGAADSPAAGNRRGVVALSGVLAAVIAWAALYLPVPYVVESPGPTYNTLGKDATNNSVIRVTGHETYPAQGRLDLTTVYVAGGPNSTVNLFGAFQAWLDGTKAVYPEEMLYPKGTTPEKSQQESALEMATSQENATAAALHELEIPFGQEMLVRGLVDGSPSAGKLKEGDVLESVNGKPVTALSVVQGELAAGAGAPATVVVNRGGTPVSVSITPVKNQAGRYVLGVLLQYRFSFPFEVKISLEKVGGPSAGMMFALGIVDTLTPGDLTGGKHIAGTGTISPEGVVGSIGGIAQKMAAARQSGASMFLAPAANCDDVVGHVPDGLQVVKVETLADARAAVEKLSTGQDTSGLPTCTAAQTAH